MATLTLSVLAPRLAHAQFGFGGAPGAKSAVVTMPEVQKDLKLSGDQKKQIQAAMKDMGNGGMTGDMASMNDNMDAKMLTGLTPDQLARLTEIWMQYEGPRVLQDKTVADNLKLTDDQRATIKDIWSQYGDSMLASMQKVRSQSGMNAIKKMKKDADAATLALLTDGQVKAFTEMQGKKIKFRMPKDI
jgi:hypothetical protein